MLIIYLFIYLFIYLLIYLFLLDCNQLQVVSICLPFVSTDFLVVFFRFYSFASRFYPFLLVSQSFQV